MASRWPSGQPATGPVGSPSEGFQAAWDLGSIVWEPGSPCTTQVLELRGYPRQKNCDLSPGSLRLKATPSLPQSCYFIAAFLLALGQRAEKEDLLAEQGQRMPNSRLRVLQREWPQSQREHSGSLLTQHCPAWVSTTGSPAERRELSSI